MEKANKILVVDDDINILALAEEALGEKGYEVITVDTGFNALNKAKANFPLQTLISEFAQKLCEHNNFTFHFSRPRFTLAKLLHIVEAALVLHL